MYKIGYADHLAVKNDALKLSEKLAANEESVQVLELKHEAAQNTGLEFYFNVLINNVADIVCVSLPSITQGLPEEIVIAGLSERTGCFEKLIYNADPDSRNPHIRLRDDAKIAVFSKRAAAIAHDLFPSWQIEVLEIRMLDKSLLDSYDGLLCSCERLDESGIDESPFALFKFHPKEFIPHPGQNVTAFLCRNDDRDLRKIVARVHVTEVSQATNIERAIDQDLSERGWSGIGVYCLVDPNYHYHVYASGITPDGDRFKRTRYSSATSESIAKNVFELLSTID